MTPQASVVICTHNPRPDFLRRVLAALKDQTLACDLWELLVVDNAGEPPLDVSVDLTWRPRGRCVREDTLGLTPARLRGIRETRGELIVFVDDDNVLDKDYLERAVEISQERPELGAWGGRISPEFETDPPVWTRAYPWSLGIREFGRDQWACLPYPPFDATPIGAGLVVRRVTAEAYAAKTHPGALCYGLGRNGVSLAGCEDLDLAYASWNCGLGTGMFTRLHLTHLIPSTRLTNAYLERFLEANAYSWALLQYSHGKGVPSENIYNRIYHALRALRRHGLERRAYYAERRGLRRAMRYLNQIDGRGPAASNTDLRSRPD